MEDIKKELDLHPCYMLEEVQKYTVRMAVERL